MALGIALALVVFVGGHLAVRVAWRVVHGYWR
jgi:hypothetical protein